MNHTLFKQLWVCLIVLLWLGSTNHCMFEALLSAGCINSTTSSVDDPSTQRDAHPCHGSDAEDHPCGVPCAKAGPLQGKINHEDSTQELLAAPALPNFWTITNSLLAQIQIALRYPISPQIEDVSPSTATLLLCSLRIPNGPPTA